MIVVFAPTRWGPANPMNSRPFSTLNETWLTAKRGAEVIWVSFLDLYHEGPLAPCRCADFTYFTSPRSNGARASCIIVNGIAKWRPARSVNPSIPHVILRDG